MLMSIINITKNCSKNYAFAFDLLETFVIDYISWVNVKLAIGNISHPNRSREFILLVISNDVESKMIVDIARDAEMEILKCISHSTYQMIYIDSNDIGNLLIQYSILIQFHLNVCGIFYYLFFFCIWMKRNFLSINDWVSYFFLSVLDHSIFVPF